MADAVRLERRHTAANSASSELIDLSTRRRQLIHAPTTVTAAAAADDDDDPDHHHNHNDYDDEDATQFHSVYSRPHRRI